MRGARCSGPWIAILPVALYLLVFFLFPLLYIVVVSFWQVAPNSTVIVAEFTLDNYRRFFSFPINGIAYWRSVYITLISVGIGTVAGYAVAYTVAFLIAPRWRVMVLLAMVVPFWTSFIVRAFSWQLFLNDTGPLAYVLRTMGLLQGSLSIIDTHAGTVIALALFSTMIVTISVFAIIDGIDRNILEASEDLGASEFQRFREIILPLSYPGLSLGIALSFIVCFGDYVAPTLLGGGVNLVLSQLLVEALRENYNVPMAATYAVVLFITIVIVSVPIILLGRRAAGLQK